MAIDAKEIERRFTYWPPETEEARQAHQRVREVCRQAAHRLVAATPAGREQSLALTALEEAMYHANAAIARPPQRA